MNEESPNGSHTSRWVLWAGLVALVYVLSIGPMAAWVEWHQPSAMGWKVIDTVYQPMVWAFQKTSPAPLMAYENWWVDRVRPSPYPFRLLRRPGIGETVLELKGENTYRGATMKDGAILIPDPSPAR
jgi:hypothetical protein